MFSDSSPHKVTFCCHSVGLVSALVVSAPFVIPACFPVSRLLYQIDAQGG